MTARTVRAVVCSIYFNAMKSLRHYSHAAFTLIELLVVIAIMIVLAGMITAVGPAVINRASKVQAASDVNQIVGGVKGYYTDYGQYPLTPTQQTDGANNKDAVFGSGSVNNDVLFNALRGTDGSANGGVANPRAIAYLQPRDAKDASNPKSGVAPTGSNKAGQWFDPWGMPYVVFIDANYDNQLDIKSVYIAAKTPLRVDVGAASFGVDKQVGYKGDGNYLTSGCDDVVSWR